MLRVGPATEPRVDAGPDHVLARGRTISQVLHHAGCCCPASYGSLAAAEHDVSGGEGTLDRG